MTGRARARARARATARDRVRGGKIINMALVIQAGANYITGGLFYKWGPNLLLKLGQGAPI